jgi:hypothetical protein
MRCVSDLAAADVVQRAVRRKSREVRDDHLRGVRGQAFHI